MAARFDRLRLSRSSGVADLHAPREIPVVAVDANGADLGPAEVAEGANLAARQGVRVLLFGPAAEMGNAGPGIEVIDAPVSIAKEANPAAAARAHPESSIVRAAKAVANGEADALVSAGDTGAALAAALFNIKRDRGILRPALAAQVPVPGAPVTLVDVGANTEVRPEHLVQFAFMGAALAQVVHGVANPRVGLLMAPALRAFRDEISPEIAGGAYLLGLRRIGVVGHGRFTARGFEQAILLAARGVTGDVVGRTHDALEAAGALRKSGQALSDS